MLLYTNQYTNGNKSAGDDLMELLHTFRRFVKVDVSSENKPFLAETSSVAVFTTSEAVPSSFNGEYIISVLRAELADRGSERCSHVVSSLSSGVGNGLFGVCIAGVPVINGESDVSCFGVLS